MTMNGSGNEGGRSARLLEPAVRDYIAERGGMLRITREAILIG